MSIQSHTHARQNVSVNFNHMSLLRMSIKSHTRKNFRIAYRTYVCTMCRKSKGIFFFNSIMLYVSFVLYASWKCMNRRKKQISLNFPQTSFNFLKRSLKFTLSKSTSLYFYWIFNYFSTIFIFCLNKIE